MTGETYTIDGIVFDLSRTYLDCLGVKWLWTGERNEAGEPLMWSHDGEPLVPLPDVYHDHGPLIPMPDARTLRESIHDWLHAPALDGAA